MRGRRDHVLAVELAANPLAGPVRELLIDVAEEHELLVGELERTVHDVAEEERALDT